MAGAEGFVCPKCIYYSRAIRAGQSLIVGPHARMWLYVRGPRAKLLANLSTISKSIVVALQPIPVLGSNSEAGRIYKTLQVGEWGVATYFSHDLQTICFVYVSRSMCISVCCTSIRRYWVCKSSFYTIQRCMYNLQLPNCVPADRIA